MERAKWNLTVKLTHACCFWPVVHMDMRSAGANEKAQMKEPAEHEKRHKLNLEREKAPPRLIFADKRRKEWKAIEKRRKVAPKVSKNINICYKEEEEIDGGTQRSKEQLK